jgi:hypothetical protein
MERMLRRGSANVNVSNFYLKKLGQSESLGAVAVFVFPLHAFRDASKSFY